MMSEIKDPSVTVYEVYTVCVIITVIRVRVFFFLPVGLSLRCPFLCTRLLCWCFLIGLAEVISTPFD